MQKVVEFRKKNFLDLFNWCSGVEWKTGSI